MLCALLGEDEGKLFVQYICLASWITVYQAIFCYKWSTVLCIVLCCVGSANFRVKSFTLEICNKV